MKILSRNELKNVKGGLQDPGDGIACSTGTCTWWSLAGYAYSGSCVSSSGPMQVGCSCKFNDIEQAASGCEAR